MQPLSTNKDVPLEVQTSAKLALEGINSGKLTGILAKAIPDILQKASAQVVSCGYKCYNRKFS